VKRQSPFNSEPSAAAKSDGAQSKTAQSKIVGLKTAESKTVESKSAKKALDDKRARVVRCIRGLPKGKVSTYGALAKAAGWPGAARQVVQILHRVPGLPWHRVVGAGGAIKLSREDAAEQQFRLRMEGVTFRGPRVNMKLHEFHFLPVKRVH
jgi:methylated-DNA-protein-cysteine methyltransferase related protein